MKFREKGYLTLEMSLIMPFVIFLICNLCYLAVFLYDNLTLIQGCYVTALIAERTLEEGEKSVKSQGKYLESIKSRVVACKEDVSMSIGRDVQVNGKIQMNTLAAWIYQSNWELNVRQIADCYEPVLFVRNIKNSISHVSSS